MHYIDLHLLSESKYMKAKLISPLFWAKKTHYIALQKYGENDLHSKMLQNL